MLAHRNLQRRVSVSIFPAYLGYAFADPSGTATLSLTVPPNPNGFALAFQAVLLAGPNSATSNTERRYNADPRDTNDTSFNGILIGVPVPVSTTAPRVASTALRSRSTMVHTGTRPCNATFVGAERRDRACSEQQHGSAVLDVCLQFTADLPLRSRMRPSG